MKAKIAIGLQSMNFCNKKGLHLVMCDLDEDCNPSLIREAMTMFAFKHGELFESTPNKFWLIVYELVPLNVLLSFQQLVYTDHRHINCTRYNQEATIRLTPKQEGYPVSFMEFGVPTPDTKSLQAGFKDILKLEGNKPVVQITIDEKALNKFKRGVSK